MGLSAPRAEEEADDLVLDGADRVGSRDLTNSCRASELEDAGIVVSSSTRKPILTTSGHVAWQEPFRRLVLRTAQHDESDILGSFIESTYRATGGTALGAVWRTADKSSRTKAESR